MLLPLALAIFSLATPAVTLSPKFCEDRTG